MGNTDTTSPDYSLTKVHRSTVGTAYVEYLASRKWLRTTLATAYAVRDPLATRNDYVALRGFASTSSDSGYRGMNCLILVRTIL